MTDQDTELMPADEVEAEPVGPEEDAVHAGEPVDQAWERLTVEDEDFEAEEILRRHYGLEEEPEGEAGEPAPREEGPGEPMAHWPPEFQCSVCFMLKPTSQLIDPARNICMDCATSELQPGRA